ncbi:hypothetical protein NDU88_004464 [Pleurodeles waltl]|uniref:Uncharacterized protein n=1 Tax=Pleurodeles waltl TaxID=8319 RepID=A0AAV7V1A7_PLEWA|nr:hypothetical protein NDU88_004464 [Pleurodeles waltl]
MLGRVEVSSLERWERSCTLGKASVAACYCWACGSCVAIEVNLLRADLRKVSEGLVETERRGGPATGSTRPLSYSDRPPAIDGTFG